MQFESQNEVKSRNGAWLHRRIYIYTRYYNHSRKVEREREIDAAWWQYCFALARPKSDCSSCSSNGRQQQYWSLTLGLKAKKSSRRKWRQLARVLLENEGKGKKWEKSKRPAACWKELKTCFLYLTNECAKGGRSELGGGKKTTEEKNCALIPLFAEEMGKIYFPAHFRDTG